MKSIHSPRLAILDQQVTLTIQPDFFPGSIVEKEELTLLTSVKHETFLNKTNKQKENGHFDKQTSVVTCRWLGIITFIVQ